MSTPWYRPVDRPERRGTKPHRHIEILARSSSLRPLPPLTWEQRHPYLNAFGVGLILAVAFLFMGYCLLVIG